MEPHDNAVDDAPVLAEVLLQPVLDSVVVETTEEELARLSRHGC